ncbi:hypothetical protein JCM16303_003345 [Sporobolomyces ruberrimus]
MSSLQTSTPLLPPEIVDEILRDDQLCAQDLRCCSLVNRSWLEPAQKSLYHRLEIRIHIENSSPDHSIFSGDPGAPSSEGWHLSPTSSMLLSMLMYRPNLGLLVKHLVLEDHGYTDTPLDLFTVWMRPQDMLATFAQLCPRATGFEVDDSWWFFEFCRSYPRFQEVKIEALFLPQVTAQEWEDLRRFKSLKKLHCEVEGPLPDTDTSNRPVLPLPLVQLKISSCTRSSLDFLRSSTSQFLRDLVVPVGILPELRVTLFPQLNRLGIGWREHDQVVDTSEFLSDLSASTSLGILELGDEVHEVFHWPRSEGCLGRYLPSSCHRVNLNESNSQLEAILSVTQRSSKGHRISQFGMSFKFRHRGDEYGMRFVAAARFLLEMVNVELIWYDCEHFM